jgi:hypothetical protein
LSKEGRRQARRWRLLKALGWGFAGLGFAASGACGDGETKETNLTAERGPLGKEDADAGTCENRCGGISDATCWCDEQCATWGDCCSDYQAACTTPVEPEKSAEQILCEQTGGGWEGDRCECQQDGYTTNYNFWFDPERGCVPGEPTPVDNATLCADTGGVWEDGACACAQDGASLHFVFQEGIGCAFPDDAPLRQVILAGHAGQFFDNFMPADGEGLYIIDRPGVADIVTRYDSAADALAYLNQFNWVSTVADAGSCTDGLQTEVFPEVSCEDDTGMTPSGCHYLSTLGIERLSALMRLTNEYQFTNYTEEEIGAAVVAEQTIFRVFVDSRHGVTFAFTYRNGAWRLVMIDLQRYSCSA